MRSVRALSTAPGPGRWTRGSIANDQVATDDLFLTASRFLAGHWLGVGDRVTTGHRVVAVSGVLPVIDDLRQENARRADVQESTVASITARAIISQASAKA
jgi:hypothetical protein